jgi:hypothetical protein
MKLTTALRACGCVSPKKHSLFVLLAILPIAMFMRPAPRGILHDCNGALLLPIQRRPSTDTFHGGATRRTGCTARKTTIAGNTFASSNRKDLPPELFSFAPMMKHTHRNFRFLFRLLSKNAWLYSEMIPADNVVDSLVMPGGDLEKMLAFSPQVYVSFSVCVYGAVLQA